MSSEFELDAEQLAFWKQENHNMGRPALAIIYPNGTVEMDYEDEILRIYKETKNYECDHEDLHPGDKCRMCGKECKVV